MQSRINFKWYKALAKLQRNINLLYLFERSQILKDRLVNMSENTRQETTNVG